MSNLDGKTQHTTDLSEKNILRKYYTDSDYLLSPEGILKVLSAIVCIVSSVLFLSGGSCRGAPALVTSAATISLASGAAMALLYSGVVLHLPLYIPQAWLFTDIISSTVIGVLLLVTAVLSVTVCELATALDYMHGPLALVTSGMVTASGVTTYVTVVRRWDAPKPHDRSSTSRPPEQDV